MSEPESRNEASREIADSIIQRIEQLKTSGWAAVDAGRYVELHHVWLHDDLMPPEKQQAEELEARYGAPAHFGIFTDREKSES